MPTTAQRTSRGQILKGACLSAGVLLSAGCTTSEPVSSSLKSGEQIYQETCSACHTTGVAGAPKYQDKGMWVPLLEEGQVVLSAHGWVGVRGMPPMGGNPNLTLEEFARAVTYMGRGAGGDWRDPDAAMLHEIREEIVERKQELSGHK